MITRTFIVEKHEEYGNVGLRPEGVPHADPLTGMAIAHDILEHFHRDDGSQEAEFMALGASLFVRGEGYFAQRGSNSTDPAEHLSGEFGLIYDALCQRSEPTTVRDPGRTTKLEDDLEELLDRMFMKARKEFFDSHEEESERRYLREPQATRMRGWFRRGYRKAIKRYKEIDPCLNTCALSSLFIDIQKEADLALKRFDWEGQRVTIAVSPRNSTVKVTYEQSEEW